MPPKRRRFLKQAAELKRREIVWAVFSKMGGQAIELKMTYVDVVVPDADDAD